MNIRAKLEADSWFTGHVFDTVRTDETGNMITGENYLVLYWDQASDSADRLAANSVHTRHLVAVQAVCVDVDGVQAWLDRAKTVLTGFKPDLAGRVTQGMQPQGRDAIQPDETTRSGLYFSEQRFRFDSDPA